MMTQMYGEKLRSLIKYGLLGAIGGALVALYFARTDGTALGLTLQLMICFAMAFAGFPYAFVHTWNALGGVIPLNLFTLLIYLFVVVLVAYIGGITVYPVVLLYTTIQYFRYKKKEQKLYE